MIKNSSCSIAAMQGYLDVVARLLNAGANPFQRTHDEDGHDALEYAEVGQRRLQAVSILPLLNC